MTAADYFSARSWREMQQRLSRPLEPRQGAAETATDDGVTPVDEQRVAPRAEGGRTQLADELRRAAKLNRASWFKADDLMEAAADEIDRLNYALKKDDRA